MTPTDLADDYAALTQDCGVVELAREAVSVNGPDALSFLQGQLSQDVDIPVGSSTWALLLSPQGKMVALLRVLRPGPDELILEVERGWAGAVQERLLRFKLRVNADLGIVEGWRCLAIRGPRAVEVAPAGTAVAWPGMVGTDLVGVSVVAPEGVRRCGIEAYETLRIEAGVPSMGAEIEESTIPAEAGVVGPSVSFTKGCYTGQELVARIDSRGGNVPRRLRGVVVEIGHTVEPGSVVRVDGADVGRITSVAFSPRTGSTVALAYVSRKVEPPAHVDIGDGPAPGEVVSLSVDSTDQPAGATARDRPQ